MVRFIFLMVFLFFTHFAYSQKMALGYEYLKHLARNYVVYQTISEINIDGNPNETSWQLAEWSDYFQDIEI